MLFEAFDVWRRDDPKVLKRYRCFRLVPGGGYCVQSADYYRPPWGATGERDFDSQFLELLSEAAPDQRSAVYPTLEEAIAAFDRDFADSPERQ